VRHAALGGPVSGTVRVASGEHHDSEGDDRSDRERPGIRIGEAHAHAGDITLTVTYWSDLSMKKWTAAANKPLSISATATLGTDQGQSVYLSKLTITPAVSNESKALPSPDPLSDPASVSPGYLVKSPYSYSQTFTLPPLDSHATSIALTIDYELLLQSTPTSAAYAKQAVSDHLTIAIAK
jgi:hypothetical protein